MKILIAEDEPIMLKTMELKLKRDGHEVITANNGRDAIQLFTDNQVDLVITIAKKQGFFGSLFTESHTKQLAFHSKVPVMVIHE